MVLTPGTRLGPYEVLAQIGVGGMGEVYKATDTNLKRAVAIKVLPASVAGDAERLARFQREAEVLAALNHPNIAQIHGLEKSDGTIALVMELVEGPTLADRIALGAIPIDEALPIAKQIAEALEAAHEQGIVHRDLKPANIKVRADGTVKVLDFGLAKAMEPTGVRAPHASMLPTITTPAMTQAGMILGTAAYMSPEQARGKAVDKRADIWAFGAVLYEMLTGVRAFEGEDLAETLGAVIHKEPVWRRLPTATPASVRTVLQWCLQKEPRQRLRDIGDAHMALEGAFETVGPDAPVPQPVSRRRVLAFTIGALIVATVAGATGWLLGRPAAGDVPRVSRLLVESSGATALSIYPNDRDLTITPDGSRVVYVGNRGTQLLVRPLDTLAPTVAFTGQPLGPFVSPDGEWIGFVEGANLMKKVGVTGGSPITLTRLDGYPRGATWAGNDAIVFATTNGTTGLQQVPASGGPTTVLTRPDRTQDETDHLWPEALPDGRGVLFTVMPVSGGLDAAQVATLDLQTGARKVLIRGGSHAHYVPAPGGGGSEREGGYLVYASAGVLRAVAFDLARLETRGAPVPVVPDVMTKNTGAMNVSAASDGTLVYVTGGGGAATSRSLVWVDRKGRETPVPAPPRTYLYPRLSPDGTRIAVYQQDQGRDIWLWTLGRTTLTKVTVDPGLDPYPVWTPDGRRLAFSSDRTGPRNVFWQAADGTGTVERLTESPNEQNATAVSPDGRHLLFQEVALETGDDVMQVELDTPHRVAPLVQTPFSERNGVVSPDGRWLAYEANDSGRFEIHVRPYPAVNSGHWQVSADGGTRPLWSHDGQELFYLSPEAAVIRVGVERGPVWATTPPTVVVKAGYYAASSNNYGRTYDISPDGQRFLLIKEGGVEPTSAPPQMIVVQHWVEELKRLVPTQ